MNKFCKSKQKIDNSDSSGVHCLKTELTGSYIMVDRPTCRHLLRSTY